MHRHRATCIYRLDIIRHVAVALNGHFVLTVRVEWSFDISLKDLRLNVV